jgi:multicomponent Na+:H+ antiporter subunit B
MRRYEEMQDPDSMILKSTVRFIFLGVVLYAGYITVKGHNEPGGGFVGGLVAALALVLVNMVLGLDEVKNIIRFDPVRVAATGLCMSYSAALLPVFGGLAFFEHHLVVAGMAVPTALIFDLGVFMVVVGVASKLIITFSSSVQMRSAFLKEEEQFYSTVSEEPIEDAAAGELPPGLLAVNLPDETDGQDDKREGLPERRDAGRPAAKSKKKKKASARKTSTEKSA